MNLLNEYQFRIMERLKTREAQSIDKLTNWLKKPKTAVRRALLDLEKKNLVKRLFKKNLRGRPTLYFQLGTESKLIFPTKEAEILNELIQFLTRKGHRQTLETFFTEYWEARYQRVMNKINAKKCRDFAARLESLKEVLNEDGFYARSNTSKNNDHVILKECHCPISAAASASGIPCKLEAQLISRVLNLKIVSAAPMSDSQRVCEFILMK